jgi:hypothetical protein
MHNNSACVICVIVRICVIVSQEPARNTKSESRSVSMPTYFWEILEDHAKAINEDRSSYLRKLATSDLSAAGKLPGNASAPVMAKFLELLRQLGPEKAAVRLDAWSQECAVQAEGGGK